MTQSELKELTNLGAELGAAKAEVARLREVLSRIANLPMYHCSTENDYRLSAAKAMAVAAISQQAEPVRCPGTEDTASMDSDSAQEQYTAVDMATAAAQGFRDGQAAMELVGYQFQGRDGAWNSFMDQRHYENTLDDGTWPIRAIYTPISEQSGKFAMHQRVRKISGSEWQGRICGTYSTALTPEGYAVESEAHAGSVQIYPAKALEAAPKE